MLRTLACLILAAALVTGALPARAAEPADPDLIPEGRRVLQYLESIYGKKTLAAVSGYGGWQPLYEQSGRIPAVLSEDAYGWAEKYGPQYRKVVQGKVDSCREWWERRGGIVAMHIHWGKPGEAKGSAWVQKPRGTGPADVGRMVTPGTPEHQAAMEDLKVTGDYLEQLAKARVPVLWRPLHEIDGGWFWWTDKARPENTAALWRMVFDYFVKERGLHNLIWVFNPAHVAGGAPKGGTLDEEIAYRKRFYPGDAYVDIAGMDIYPAARGGWGMPQEDTYPRGFEMMEKIAPGKMHAMCEGAALPNPDILAAKGPGWLYCLQWWSTGKNNPPQWVRQTLSHPQYLTMDELPPLVGHNVAPDVRLTTPADGADLAAGPLTLQGWAGDRDGNLKGVELRFVQGPWRNWFLEEDAAVEELIAGAVKLGEARLEQDGKWSLALPSPPAGVGSVVALARDAEGLVTRSNMARVVAGCENLARGKAMTASSGDSPAQAGDAELFTSWDGKRDGEQWLAVDLGAERSIGAVAILWSKALARDYRIQVSGDATTWRDVPRTGPRAGWKGGMEVARFDPMPARHVRVLCTTPGTDWGGYSIYDLGVFARLPEAPPAQPQAAGP